jgi:hypothetical protein
LSTKQFEQLDGALVVQIVRLREELRMDKEAIGPSGHDNVLAVALSSTGNDLVSDLAAFHAGHLGAKLADMTLVLGGERVPAHKAILAARCSYFRAMYNSGLLESRTNELRVSIGNLVPSVQSLGALLRYIYFGDGIIAPENAMYLLPASDFYGFSNSRLQVLCRQSLEMNVSVGNVFGILEAADSIGAAEMKRHALHLIVKDFSVVAKQPEMRRLSRELLLEVIDAVATQMAGKSKPHIESTSI